MLFHHIYRVLEVLFREDAQRAGEVQQDVKGGTSGTFENEMQFSGGW